jgi:3-hydroxy-9,10-secoandrosta-1,3,5(10)-triene-9,17-dione monooxygenase reductase component
VHSFDASHFKATVGHFATGVAVITALTPEGPAGFTCQTFGSLSLDPFLVSFSAQRGGRSWPRVRAAQRIGVNVLAEDQETTARTFAASGVEKFDGVGWSPSSHGTPLLDGALAHLEGEILEVATHGDHDLVVASVEFARSHGGRPLLYYRGEFNRLASE